MSSPYVNVGRGQGVGSAYTHVTPSGNSGRKAKKKHRGVFGAVGHVFSQGGQDLYHAAINAPGGIAAVGEAVGQDIVARATHPLDPSRGSHTAAIAKATAEQAAETLRHPLRRPGDTLLTVLPFGEGIARVGEAAAAVRAGGTAADVSKALAGRGGREPRVFRAGDLEVKGTRAKSALGRAGQRAYDKQVLARSEGLSARKVGKELARNQRILGAQARGPAAALVAAGHKLTAEQQTALRTVAEGAKTDERIAYHQGRARGVGKAERARHEKKIQLLEGSRQYLDETGARPRVSAEHPDLQRLYAQTAKVAKGRESVLEQIGHMTPEAAQGRVHGPGRVVRGAEFERTPAVAARVAHKRTYPTPRTREEAVHVLGELDREYERVLAKVVGGIKDFDPAENARRNRLRAEYERQQQGVTRSGRASGASKAKVRVKPPTLSQEWRTQAEEALAKLVDRHPDHPVVQRLAQLREDRANLRDAIQRTTPGVGEGGPADFGVGERTVRVAAREARPAVARLTGAEGFEGGEFRVPYTRTAGPRNLMRNATAGQAGKVTVPKAPGSLTHQFTGGLLRGGDFRNETTRVVGESNLEAQRYAGLLALRDQLKKASVAEPRTQHDIPIRLDKLKAGGLSRDEQALLEKVESGGKLSADEQKAATSLHEKVRSSLFMKKPLEMTPDERAVFHRLHDDGKIAWVDRRLLRGLDKPAPQLEAVLGRKTTKAIDAVNNTARLSYFYGKVGYALPNMLSNAALNLIQQGPVALPNLVRAIRLSGKFTPDTTARIDEMMGEGISRSFAGEKGVGSRAVQGAANSWSKVVDRAFRRSSFLYEANRAGYRTPEQVARLLEDRAHQDKLVEVTRHATDEILDYEGLTPREKELVRRIVFVYAFQKASVKYGGALARNHPVQVGIADQLAQVGEKKSIEDFGALIPSYFEGAFKVATAKSGNPIAINPGGVNVLQAPAQIGSAAAALVTGHPLRVAEAANFATPAAEIAGGLIQGKGLKASLAAPATSAPQYVLAQRLRGKGSATYPATLLNALGPFLIGSLTPRETSPMGLHKSGSYERSRR